MPGRRTRLPNTVEYRTQLSSLRLWWRTPSNHNSASTQIVRIKRDAIASGNEVSNFSARNEGRERFSPSRAGIFIRGRSLKWCLGFTTARCLGNHPQRVSRLSSTLLLELVNPIGHRLHHIARGFTSGRSLRFNNWTSLLALFNYLDCFLLRHC